MQRIPLSKKKQVQEDQYLLPYHYMLRKDSPNNLLYFSYIDLCVKLVDESNFKKMLDIGTGDGYFLSRINAKNRTLHGLDYSPRAIALAKVMNMGKKELSFFQGDMLNLTLIKPSSYDVVTCIAVLEHIESKYFKQVISAIRRVLKVGGKLILALPTPNLDIPEKHYKHYTRTEVEKLVSRFFKVQAYHFRFNKFFRLIYKLAHNRYYNINIFSNFLRLTIFNKYFLSATEATAEMIVYELIVKK